MRYNPYEGTKLINNILRLSDAFRFNDHGFSMELTVKVIDVNYESGSKVLYKSPSLEGYSYLIFQIRRHTNSGIARDKAISLAVNHCIEKDILADFLRENYEEVCGMLAWECTYEDELAIKKEEGIEEGIEKGKEEGYLEAATNFLQSGFSFQDVARILKLSETQIRDLKARIV